MKFALHLVLQNLCKTFQKVFNYLEIFCTFSGYATICLFVQGCLSSICQIFCLLEPYHLPSAQPTGDKISIQVVK